MNIRRFFFSAILLAAVIVTVPLYWPSSTPEVTPDALMGYIGNGEAPAILDVRTRPEFDGGHLPNAIHASVFTLYSEHDNLAISQQETLVLYCGSGLRARVGALILRLAGYESVYILEGQLNRWKKGGYPVIAT
ncbi:MAG: rhodanese-like domain-containing protein [Rhodothermales bacterium]